LQDEVPPFWFLVLYVNKGVNFSLEYLLTIKNLFFYEDHIKLLERIQNTSHFSCFIGCRHFFIRPLAHDSYIFNFLATFLLAANLVLGVYTVKTSRIIKNASLLLAIIVVSIEILNLNWVYFPIKIFGLLSWIGFVGCLLYVFLIKIFENHSYFVHRIQGGIACYLLIGILFSFVHSLIFNLDNSAYSFPSNFSSEGLLAYRFIYFSFTTLTTVGFGDISPTQPFPQSITALEAINGTLFPTVLIGYLISDATSRKM